MTHNSAPAKTGALSLKRKTRQMRQHFDNWNDLYREIRRILVANKKTIRQSGLDRIDVEIYFNPMAGWSKQMLVEVRTHESYARSRNWVHYDLSFFANCKHRNSRCIARDICWYLWGFESFDWLGMPKIA